MGWAKRPISQVRSTGEWGAELWPLTSDLPPQPGIRAAATQSAAEHNVRVPVTRRRRKSPGARRSGGGLVAVGPCKPSAGPTRRQRGGPDAARASAGTGLLIGKRASISRPLRPGMQAIAPLTTARRGSPTPPKPLTARSPRVVSATLGRGRGRTTIWLTSEWGLEMANEIQGNRSATGGRVWRGCEDDPVACAT